MVPPKDIFALYDDLLDQEVDIEKKMKTLIT